MKWLSFFRSVPLRKVTAFEDRAGYRWQLFFTGITLSRRLAIGFVFSKTKAVST